MSTIEELNKVYETFDPVLIEIADANQFPYIFSKANTFLKVGPAIYRKDDFFGMPSTSWDENMLALITRGCEQILLGRGLAEDRPLLDLGTDGFYNLFAFFHFEFKKRKTLRKKIDGKTIFLDIIDFEHVVNHSVITYCNLVSY